MKSTSVRFWLWNTTVLPVSLAMLLAFTFSLRAAMSTCTLEIFYEHEPRCERENAHKVSTTLTNAWWEWWKNVTSDTFQKCFSYFSMQLIITECKQGKNLVWSAELCDLLSCGLNALWPCGKILKNHLQSYLKHFRFNSVAWSV